MAQPVFDTIRVRRRGARAELLLNRPERRNALTHAMMVEIGQALEWLDGQQDARLLLIEGAGGNFCAGGDIAAMEQMPAKPESGPDPLVAPYRLFGDVLARLNRLPIPVIALVQGAAVGGGFGMACCADIVIADPTAKFGLPEPKAGFIPSQIIPYVVRTMGESAARYMAITSDVISAETAQRHGIVHFVEADRGAMGQQLEVEENRVLRGAPAALAAVKTLVLNCATDADEKVLDDAATALVELLRSDAAEQGMAAFFAKEPPPWYQPSAESVDT